MFLHLKNELKEKQERS